MEVNLLLWPIPNLISAKEEHSTLIMQSKVLNMQPSSHLLSHRTLRREEEGPIVDRARLWMEYGGIKDPYLLLQENCRN